MVPLIYRVLFYVFFASISPCWVRGSWGKGTCPLKTRAPYLGHITRARALKFFVQMGLNPLLGPVGAAPRSILLKMYHTACLRSAGGPGQLLGGDDGDRAETSGLHTGLSSSWLRTESRLKREEAILPALPHFGSNEPKNSKFDLSSPIIMKIFVHLQG